MMKNIVLFSLLLSSFSISAKICDVGQFAELEPIADAPFETHKKCLRTISDAPTTPTYPAGLFEKLAGEEVFASGCNLPDSKDFQTYVILTSKGIKTIRFPIFNFMIGNLNNTLPGDITHFKHEGKDYYVSPNYGEARILTKEQLPALAAEMDISMTKVYSKIKKYEDYLKSVDKLDEIIVKSDAGSIEKVMPCFEKVQEDTVKTYFFGKFGKVIPAYSTIINDYNKFSDLDEESRKKYLKPFDELKKEVISDLADAQPICKGVISDEILEAAFERSWGENKQYYEVIRKRFAPAGQ